MTDKLNVVLLITDGHGYHTNDMDWGTSEFLNLKQRFDQLELEKQGYVRFTNVASPAVSTIMSIESIMSGLLAAKTHKMHWREWPAWDRFTSPVLSDFLAGQDYKVYGFSYLLNSENWLPSLYCYRPEIYKEFPSHKRDTHSHEAVLAAVRHFFANEFTAGGPHLLIVHSIFLFDLWAELMHELQTNGFTQDNTIFAFTSDHYFPKNFGRFWLFGERDNAPVYHHSDLTEYNSRVFFYLKYPGSTHCDINTVVAGYDITPTIINLLGLENEWPGEVDGISLLPLVHGDSLPPRLLRSDNVYPYQVGEKQGRITAIRAGRYKYVFRPDPASSYITYRMSENWSTVLASEEFYDIEADPEESINLVGSTDLSQQAILDLCRDFYRTTTESIIRHHAGTLHAVFRQNRLGELLFRNLEHGELLMVQTCPDVVFATIIHVINAMLPGWNIDLLVRKDFTEALPEVHRILIYPDADVYQQKTLAAVLQQYGSVCYDCLLNTSNVPIGDYATVYDESHYPVGDFAVSGEFLEAMSAATKGSLCLDMAFVPFKNRSFLQRINPALLLFSKMKNMLLLVLPHARKIIFRFVSDKTKISRYLSGRIIDVERK